MGSQRSRQRHAIHSPPILSTAQDISSALVSETKKDSLSNLERSIILTLLDSFDSLDRIGDVGEIDEA